MVLSFPRTHRRSSLLARWHNRVIENIRGKATPGHVECYEDTSGLRIRIAIPFTRGGLCPRIT